MIRFSFSSLRFRLILLVLLAVIPAVALMLYTTVEQHRLEAAHVQEDVLRLARLAVLDDKQLIDGTRQLLVVLAHLPEVRGGDPAL